MSIGDLNRLGACARLPQRATQNLNAAPQDAVTQIPSNAAGPGGVNALVDTSRNPLLSGFDNALQRPPSPLAQRQEASANHAAPGVGDGAPIPTTGSATPRGHAINRSDISFLVGANEAPRRDIASIFAALPPPVIPEDAAIAQDQAGAANQPASPPADPVAGAPPSQDGGFAHSGPSVTGAPPPAGMWLPPGGSTAPLFPPHPFSHAGGVNIVGNVTFNYITVTAPTPAPSPAIGYVPLPASAPDVPKKRSHEETGVFSALSFGKVAEPEKKKQRGPGKPLVSVEDATEIRNLAPTGMIQLELAAKYDTTPMTISSIVNYKFIYATPAYNVKPPSVRKSHKRHCRVTPEKAQEIRDLYETRSMTQTKIAEKYGISSSTVNEIINYRRAYAPKTDNPTNQNKDNWNKDDDPDNASNKT